VSNTSMNVASVTVRAINHGLYFGFQGASRDSVKLFFLLHRFSLWGFVCEPARASQDPMETLRLKPVLLKPNFRDDRHPRPQTVKPLLPGFETYADRQALDNLDVVTGRVLRREQAGDRACRAGHGFD